MRNASKVEVEVPVEQFCDGKCTSLALFQVPGTPILPKIYRDLGGHVGNTTGHLYWEREATGQFLKNEWPACQKKWPAGHFAKSGGNFVLLASFL